MDKTDLRSDTGMPALAGSNRHCKAINGFYGSWVSGLFSRRTDDGHATGMAAIRRASIPEMCQARSSFSMKE